MIYCFPSNMRYIRMKENPKFTVETETTLLQFLLENINKSRNHIKGLLKRGQIRVDGKARTDFALALRPGQRVEVQLGAPLDTNAMELPIIFEDEDIIVIDKPAGMLTIATDKESENTAYHIVYEYMKRKPKPGRVFIVHRLDRETSGVLLLAKREPVKLRLQESWTEAVKRRGYIAVVEGVVHPPEGQIKSWLKQTKTLLVYSSDKKDDGQLAITNYETLKTAEKYTLLDISLETGRKNQIRVHMKDIGSPVAGDKKYGAQTNPLKRLALHASELIVLHPESGEEMVFTAPMPKVFNKLL